MSILKQSRKNFVEQSRIITQLLFMLRNNIGPMEYMNYIVNMYQLFHENGKIDNYSSLEIQVPNAPEIPGPAGSFLFLILLILQLS